MKNKYLILLLTIAIGCGLPAACTKQNAGAGRPKEPPANVQPYVRKEEEAQAKKKALETEYKAMQVADLAKKLEEDSGKDVEPFNSLAFREASVRGAEVGAELARSVKNPNRSSFLTLMAVRKINKDEYNKIDPKMRVAILVDALGTSKFFNTWGLPHLYWEDTAKAIIESGRLAVPELTRLLRDKRDAPVWGSEEVAEYQKYKYRICDYAMALIMEIQQKKGEIPLKQEDRDRVILTMGNGGIVPPIKPVLIKPVVINPIKIKPRG